MTRNGVVMDTLVMDQPLQLEGGLRYWYEYAWPGLVAHRILVDMGFWLAELKAVDYWLEEDN